jgi:hypothetical protein
MSGRYANDGRTVVLSELARLGAPRLTGASLGSTLVGRGFPGALPAQPTAGSRVTPVRSRGFANYKRSALVQL